MFAGDFFFHFQATAGACWHRLELQATPIQLFGCFAYDAMLLTYIAHLSGMIP